MPIDEAWDQEKEKEIVAFWNKVYDGSDGTTGVEEKDMVNHPDHYNKGGIETIDAIESALGEEGSKFYHTGNVLKYMWRWQYKNGIEDLKKARWYLDRLIRNLEMKGRK